jgi:hypothetical protein
MFEQQLLGGVPMMGAAVPAVRQRRQTRRRSETPALDQLGRDLTAEARDGRIDPVIGRESEIGCSRPSAHWSGSTCPSTASRTRWPG